MRVVEVLSRLVSYGIVAGGGVVKLPQIVNVVKARTGRGLSLGRVYVQVDSDTVATLTLMGLAFNVLVGNPFRTYGDLLLIQNLVVGAFFVGLQVAWCGSGAPGARVHAHVVLRLSAS